MEISGASTFRKAAIDMAAFSYSYRVHGINKTPADVVGGVCQRLQDSGEGLSPETLLNASRAENAPLHGEFEWDDKIAGEKYRLNQAGDLIRNLIIVPVTTEEKAPPPSRAFVSTPGGKSVYVSIRSALSTDAWRDHLLKEARREMGSFVQKYRRLKELAGVISEIENYLDGEAM